MRIRTLYIATPLLLLSSLCFGQAAPGAPLSTPYGNDISLSYMLVDKSQRLDIGNGVDLTATHSFTRNLGVIAETEAMSVNRFKLDEYACRFGPIYRFNAGQDFQPFLRVSAGFSKVNATYHTKVNNFGGSVQLGAGTDIRIKRALFARFAIDGIDDWNATTRFVRGTAGFAYHFGEINRSR